MTPRSPNLSLFTLAIILGLLAPRAAEANDYLAVRFPEAEVWATDVIVEGPTTWFLGNGTLYSLKGSSPREYSNVTKIHALQALSDGSLVAIGYAGSFRIRGESVEPIQLPEPGVHVESIEEVGGLLWLKTHSDLKVYQLDGLATRDIRSPDSVQKMFWALGAVWLTTTNDVYRVDSGCRFSLMSRNWQEKRCFG